MDKDSSTQARHVHRYQALIQSRSADLSTAEQAVAAHLAAHPEQLPFETADSIAKRLGVSSMTVGRTLKALGYQGLGELRSESACGDAGFDPRAVGQARRHCRRARSKNLERARAMRAELERSSQSMRSPKRRCGGKSSTSLLPPTRCSLRAFKPSAGWPWRLPISLRTCDRAYVTCQSTVVPSRI